MLTSTPVGRLHRILTVQLPLAMSEPACHQLLYQCGENLYCELTNAQIIDRPDLRPLWSSQTGAASRQNLTVSPRTVYPRDPHQRNPQSIPVIAPATFPTT